LALSRERAYYKAVRQAITALGSDGSLKEKLDTIARLVSRSFDTGASIVLLDSTRTRLIHTASWKLPPFYLRKGLLDAVTSLQEVAGSQPVFIEDISHDGRVQYPEMAEKAGISSILGVPVACSGETFGAIRIYFKEPCSLTNQDTSFALTMAHLAALALCGIKTRPANGSSHTAEETPETPGQGNAVHFAHESEKEFARILDFYGISWIYEPRSFPLENKNAHSSEMFTPDFYIPSLDLYVELTTMKQTLVTHKNRKLRRLKALYPEIKISLLYKNDYDRLLAKYGAGPLAQSRAHSIRQVLYSASEIDKRVRQLAEKISADYAERRPILIGVQRGFLCFMADLMRQITVPLDLDFMAISYYGRNKGVSVTKDIDIDIKGRHVILVEDIVDTGITLNYMLKHLRDKSPDNLAVCALLDRRARRLVDVKLDYVGFEVPDEFVVGYGLDFHEEYRNLPFIAIPEIKEFPAKPEHSGKSR
jgi:hypoxanthine phosphoribosyltransferase